MTLQAELQTFRAAFMAKAAPEIRDAMARADADLAASGLLERAARAGDLAPDFTLTDQNGAAVALSGLLKDGPVVLSFYRGGWCPYCNLELRALQARLADFRRLGARLIAVSPESPDGTVSTSEKNALTFPVLSDHGSRVARAFGVAFDLADELRPIYARFGHALPDVNDHDSWTLPVPATFLIDVDGAIALAFVDVDYRSRLEPADIVAALEALADRRAG